MKRDMIPSNDQTAFNGGQHLSSGSCQRDTKECVGQHQPSGERHPSSHIKEVWFPGTHSDM